VKHTIRMLQGINLCY